MSPRTMYDSVTWQAIPADAQIVAGYLTGRYAWPAEAWSRFARAEHVGIVVRADHDQGDVLDVENGDATPPEARGWVQRRLAAGHVRPTVYCSLSVVPDVRAQLGALPHALWVAHYTGRPHTVGVGESAVQYADPHTSGGNYDLSIVTDDAWPYGGDDVPLSDDDVKRIAAAIFGQESPDLHGAIQWVLDHYFSPRLDAIEAALAALRTKLQA